MKQLKKKRVKIREEVPENFTGIAEYPSGLKQWYKNGKLHREDGPAIEYADGTRLWFKNGKYHREDGPAIEYADGTKKWWLKGKRFYPVTEKSYVIIDEYQGLYGLTWLKVLLKDQIIEMPDVPGLITK